MSPWEILGIEKTSDKKQIKRAYAKMLKVYHPEDDEDGFLKLKSAYEEALRQCDNIVYKESKFDNASSELIDGVDLLCDIKSGNYNRIDIDKEMHSNILGEISLLYDDVFKRRDIKCWRNFFLQLSIDEFNILNKNAVNYFNTNCHLPREVWNLLDEELMLCNNVNFKWTNFVKYDFGLNFDYLDERLDCDYNKYSLLRFKAFEAFTNLDYQSAIKYAMDSYEIFDKDPVLHRITGVSYYMLNETTKAFEFFTKSISLDCKDVDSLSYRAKIFFDMGEYFKAKKDYESIIEIDNNNIEGQKGIAKCLLIANRRKYLDLLLKKDFKDIELDILLLKHEQLKHKTMWGKILKNFYDLKDKSKTKRIVLDIFLIVLLLPAMLWVITIVPFLAIIFFVLFTSIFLIRRLGDYYD